jgi:antitoxin VapB
MKEVPMPSAAVAKIFMNGRSQAVRLPKEYRFDTDEVYISKEDGRIILTPKTAKSWKEFFEVHEPCPDFGLDRDDEPPQKRELF